MKYLGIVLLLMTFGVNPAAFAGAPEDVIKYNVEGGVKVYRNELSPEQKMTRLVRQTVFQAEQRAQAQKQAEAAQQQQALAAFERGYARGRQQTQEEQTRTNQNRRPSRSRYGRRYTTSYYGYGGYRRYYYRPSYHGPRRRKH